MREPWDFLVVTASNDEQARAYEAQLALRRRMGLLADVRETLVVADPGGCRIGSGGSTLYSLARVADLERRVLILHAGGDSRRLPAYGPCGKIFVPVPGESGSALGNTMFDCLVPRLLALPGQIVVAAGDALLEFDPEAVDFGAPGMTLLGCRAEPEEAARHGVFCLDAAGGLRLYLQKPSVEEQAREGAIDRRGKAVLDIGLMSFDAETARVLLEEFGGEGGAELDLYREICGALGSEATPERYFRTARSAGPAWNARRLAEVFPALQRIPVRVQALERCGFLHFGATRELISSGRALAGRDNLAIDTRVTGAGRIEGANYWVEGCTVAAPLTLAGGNAVVGADIAEPLALPEGACLDVIEGRGRQGNRAWFVRCYAIGDAFKDARFFGRPLDEWLAAAGAEPQGCALWDARVFPAVARAEDYRRWLWMFDVDSATAAQKREFLDADRYSAAEIALAASQDAFHERRHRLRAAAFQDAPARVFSPGSAFSAEDLAFSLAHAPNRAACVSALLEACDAEARGMEAFVFARMAHTLGSALGETGDGLRAAAFRAINGTILRSSIAGRPLPRNSLRSDETIWGRAPARIELGGGWTDTPPYTLEHGGDVINAAVNLNGQPPIHCYGRVVEEPVIRLSSIDAGKHVEIATVEELLDCHGPADVFALAKAALAISGFSPQMAPWPEGTTLRAMLEQFGGGIELTTLVGIPKGSGLGTSSILGAAIVAVIGRMLGRALDRRELFHDVLRLEQALTTGGGWQDQIGGGVGGTKITSTRPGLFPDPRIHFVPDDVLDPKLNGGSTLLYYTGLTRLAKNILEQIVGGYLNRDRAIMSALAREHEVARAIAEAMSRKDAAAFGRGVDAAWELQKRLCGTVTNPAIETLLARVRPYVHGMRISGAGSGGFLLIIAKSPRDAARVREMLEREPLNERARFFDFEVNHTGLEVTAC